MHPQKASNAILERVAIVGGLLEGLFCPLNCVGP
jgi:hypothetical protein